MWSSRLNQFSDDYQVIVKIKLFLEIIDIVTHVPIMHLLFTGYLV
jgi:hypothetical protein